MPLDTPLLVLLLEEVEELLVRFPPPPAGGVVQHDVELRIQLLRELRPVRDGRQVRVRHRLRELGNAFRALTRTHVLARRLHVLRREGVPLEVVELPLQPADLAPLPEQLPVPDVDLHDPLRRPLHRVRLREVLLVPAMLLHDRLLACARLLHSCSPMRLTAASAPTATTRKSGSQMPARLSSFLPP